MKSPFRLSAFLAFLFLYACLPGSAWCGGLPLPSSSHDSGQPADVGKPIVSEGITIPGQLRSFLRMAAISQKISPKQVLPLLARNVAMEGYGWRGRSPQPTEYLILLKGYLKQARELRALADPNGVIRVSDCSKAEPLLTTLGYRLRQACGPDTSVETANPKKAFLTIDSGFPLTDLEDTLRENKPFVYAFPTSQVPVLLDPSDWAKLDRKNRQGDKPRDENILDSLVSDPALARLYWALARMDTNTVTSLQRSPGLAKLVPLAPVLDFYGSQIYIRSGRVIVPGGASAESAWADLAGANPKSAGSFVTHLLAKDEGWLAAYYDAMSRISGDRQAYFTEPHRLRSFYRALRGQVILPSPVRPVFRPNADLLLLVSRLQFDSSGRPHIPGNLETWKEIFRDQRNAHSKVVRSWAGRASGWKNSDHLIEAMFALSRVSAETNLLHLYLQMSEIDRRRSPEPGLSPKAVRLLADNFSKFGDQYPIFSEFRGLDDNSISRFLKVEDSLDHIHERALRGDAAGIFQANIGLWQILARQGQIPTANWNDSWQHVINPFSNIRSSAQLFDSARGSLEELLRAASGNPHLSQDEIVILLAGPVQSSPEAQRVRQELASRIGSVIAAQRLVSLDTLFALGDGLNQMAQGNPAPEGLIQQAGALREFQMPKPLFTGSERTEWSYGLFGNPHVEAEMATDLSKIIKSRSPTREKGLAAARGQLVPFLRDTLVGLNYAYYQPPGAQALYSDPLLVRFHDFSGEAVIGAEQEATWKTPSIVGRGWTASGGAHLVGSLTDLPYILAEVEQDFIVPENVQALIWEDLTPTLLTASVVPRWWQVTPNELHAVALYQKFGEELVTAAAENEDARQRLMTIVRDRMLPVDCDLVEQALIANRPEEALAQLEPADTFYLAAEFRRKFPDDSSKWGKSGQELDQLSRLYPSEVSWERLSEDFGSPHPALAETYASELLNVKPFPTFLGYSSRLLAESWESNNLYWARLADQMGYPPVMLNLLVPDLTRRMISKIFATDLEDRPALLRALKETGDGLHKGELAVLTSGGDGSGH